MKADHLYTCHAPITNAARSDELERLQIVGEVDGQPMISYPALRPHPNRSHLLAIYPHSSQPW